MENQNSNNYKIRDECNRSIVQIFNFPSILMFYVFNINLM